MSHTKAKPDSSNTENNSSMPTDRHPDSTDSLRRELFLLALPVLGEQFLTFCIDLFDVYLSGQLGTKETSAVGLAGYVSWLASMIFSLVGIGTTAIVARAWGAGRFDEARRIAGRSLTIAPVIGLAVFCLLQLLATGFPRLLSMEGEEQRIAVEFLRIDACGQFFKCWSLIAFAAFRGAGDMLTPLRVLLVTNSINVVFSRALTLGVLLPGSFELISPMGVRGIVVGTTISHFSGALFVTLLLFSNVAKLTVTRHDFGFHSETIRRILRIGGPAALGGLCTFVGHFSFLMVISKLANGSTAANRLAATDAIASTSLEGANFAAHFVGVRFEALSYLPVEAFGIAAASLVGQALGTQQFERAKQVGKEALRQCLWYAAMMMCLFFIFAPQIYGGMHSDPAVAFVGVPAFRLMALFQVPNAILIVYAHSLRGAGDTRFPLYCSLIGNVVVRVSIGYYFGVYMQYGLFGAWVGMGADNILRSILISWRYLAGRWTQIKV